MFFGTVVKPGKPIPVVPHADGFALHLSQVALPADVKEKSRVSLLVRIGDEEPVVLCTLTAGVRDTVLLDQFLTEYAELSVVGAAPVHVTGYYSPSFGSPEEDEDEDEDGQEYGVPGGRHPLEHMFGMGAHDAMMDDDNDDSDDEDEEDEEGESDDSEGLMGGGPEGQREPSVIIEDITDQQPAKPGVKALPAADNKAADKKRKSAEAGSTPAKKQAVQPSKDDQKQKKQEQPQQPKLDGRQQQQNQKQQQAPGAKQQAADVKQQKQQQQAKQQKQQQEARTPDAASPGTTAAGVVSAKKGVKRFENGFEVHSLKMGDPHGKLAKAGKVVRVRYTGRLKNGKVFDKSGNKPFSFRLGVGEVIKGWDAGVEGMRVGDTRKLVVPPVMAYGSNRTGPIPPNSTLEFDVELVDVK